MVVTAQNDLSSAQLWDGDANGGYRTSLELPFGSEVDIHHTFGDLVFYAWDWYPYDNNPNSYVVANLYGVPRQPAAVMGDNNADQAVVTATPDGGVAYQVTSGGNVIQSGAFAPGANVPLLDLGAGSTVTVNGASAGNTFTLEPNKVVVNGVTLDATDASNSIASWQVNGGYGTDQFNLSGAVGDMSIQTGAGVSTVSFASGSSTTGVISGSGNTTLDYSAYGAAVTVNLASGSATATQGVSGISTVELGDGASNVTGTGATTLIGPNETNTWNVASTTDGTIGYVKKNVRSTVTYAGIGNLVGGARNDTFLLASGVMPAGAIDGGAGANTLSFNAYVSTPPVSLDLHGGLDAATSGSAGFGFANVATLVGGASNSNSLTGPMLPSTWALSAAGAGSVGGISFRKFQNLVGWSNDDTLTGVNTNSTWVINGTNAGKYNTSTSFAGIANLIGGAGPDVFKILAAGKVTSIDGGGAPAGQGNWLDYSVFKTAVNVNLATGSATNVNGGANGAVANIQDARGGAGNDALTGNSQGNILVGGAGNDVLNGGSGVSLLIGGKGADTINGGSGGDLIIGDSTKYDTNNTALMDILDEWQSAKSYATRVADIENGGGLNKSFVLDYGNGTVIDDKAADQLYGGVPTNNPDDDWFFQGVAVADTIFNWETGEIISQA